jgi:putative membrane protein
MTSYLATLTDFALYFGVSIGLVLVFLLLYTWLTPYRESELIQAGNRAAALSLAGACLGYTLPLASAIAHSVDLYDLLAWGLVAMVVQLGLYAIVRVSARRLVASIEQDRTAVGIALAALSLSVGMLNAACMTP